MPLKSLSHCFEVKIQNYIVIVNNHLLSDVLGGQHSGVGRGLVPVGFDLHPSGDPADGLTAGQVSHVDEGVVEGGVDVSHSENQLPVFDLKGNYKYSNPTPAAFDRT